MHSGGGAADRAAVRRVIEFSLRKPARARLPQVFDQTFDLRPGPLAARAAGRIRGTCHRLVPVLRRASRERVRRWRRASAMRGGAGGSSSDPGPSLPGSVPLVDELAPARRRTQGRCARRRRRTRERPAPSRRRDRGCRSIVANGIRRVMRRGASATRMPLLAGSASTRPTSSAEADSAPFHAASNAACDAASAGSRPTAAIVAPTGLMPSLRNSMRRPSMRIASAWSSHRSGGRVRWRTIPSGSEMPLSRNTVRAVPDSKT